MAGGQRRRQAGLIRGQGVRPETEGALPHDRLIDPDESTGRRTALVLKDLKTRRSRRVLHLTPALLALLPSIRQRRGGRLGFRSSGTRRRHRRATTTGGAARPPKRGPAQLATGTDSPIATAAGRSGRPSSRTHRLQSVIRSSSKEAGFHGAAWLRTRSIRRSSSATCDPAIESFHGLRGGVGGGDDEAGDGVGTADKRQVAGIGMTMWAPARSDIASCSAGRITRSSVPTMSENLPEEHGIDIEDGVVVHRWLRREPASAKASKPPWSGSRWPSRRRFASR